MGYMGDDTPLPMLSEEVRSLYDSFHQCFAPVTNPPIYPIREQMAMYLEVYLGGERNRFSEGPAHARRLVLDSSVVSPRHPAPDSPISALAEL